MADNTAESSKGVALHTVAFPKKGKGVKGLTFTAMVFGIPKTTAIKDDAGVEIGRKFLFLEYDKIITGVREAEVLKFIDEAKYDRIEVFMRGYDAMARSAQSGGSSLEAVIITRLRTDGVRADLTDDKQRDVRLGAIARAILADVREMGADLEETYAEKTAKILKAFAVKADDAKTDDDDEDDDETDE